LHAKHIVGIGPIGHYPEGLVSTPRRSIAIVLIVPLLAVGCFASRAFPPPGRTDWGRFGTAGPRAVPPAANPAAVVPAAAAAPAGSASRTILAISGGGSYGAHTAGVLKGWTASGTRPQFDVVTGVSTGALIASFAFLGPEYDGPLEAIYTGTSARDIFRWHSLPRLPWSDALADSAPLRRIIEATVTPEVLDKIAAAHRSGRRLYVATTDLDSKRQVVWDMGAIAASENVEKRELFCKVLLASSAVPGLLPPVPIDITVDGKRRTELHVDGAISAAVFVQPGMLSHEEASSDHGVHPSKSEHTRIYVLVSGKLFADTDPVPRRVVDVTAASLNCVLMARLREDVHRIYRLAHRAGAEFAVAQMADDFPGAPTSISFDPATMRKMFDEGYRVGSHPATWRTLPPGTDSEEQPKPRDGVQFSSPPKPS
jgi:predicted patatin/cPLA2 family phospholipase